MKIKGTVKAVFDTQVINDKFKKRDLILTTDVDGKYPQHLTIQFVQDKVSLLDGLNVGEGLEVSINLRGREYKDKDLNIKYFNTIEGWRLENASVEPSATETPKEDLPF